MEMRSTRREGSFVIDEYERVNPDDTVTKVMTYIDQTTGAKHHDVYNLNRSGVIRKAEGAEAEWYINKAESKNMQMENQPYRKHCSSARHAPGEDLPRDEFLQLMRDFKVMNALDRMAVFNKYKNKLIEYGTKRLENILKTKLSNEKPNSPLSDEQKDQLVVYGVQKMKNLIMKNLSQELFFSEILPRYERETLSPTTVHTNQRNEGESLSQSMLRFEQKMKESLNGVMPNEIEKSLEMQKKEEVIKFALQGMRDATKDSEVIRNRINEEYYERRKNNNLNAQKHAKEPEENSKKIRKEEDTESYQNELSDIMDYLGDKLRKKPREEMTNKKYDKLLYKVFDEEDILDVGTKVLRKMLKKRHEEEFKDYSEELLLRKIQKEPKSSFEYLSKQQSKPDISDENNYGGRQREITSSSENNSTEPEKLLDLSPIKGLFESLGKEINDMPNSEGKEKNKSFFVNVYSILSDIFNLFENEKASLSSRAGTSENGLPYETWKGLESKQKQEEKPIPSQMDDVLSRLYKAFSPDGESRPIQTRPQQTDSNKHVVSQRKPITFRIHPQESTRNELPPRTIANSVDNGNMPWWFNGTSDFVEEPFMKTAPVKPPVPKSLYFDSPFVNSGLFNGQSNFSGPLLGDY